VEADNVDVTHHTVVTTSSKGEDIYVAQHNLTYTNDSRQEADANPRIQVEDQEFDIEVSSSHQNDYTMISDDKNQ
jgi:hypothetical protein